jgi:hypothetical protein
MLSAVERPTWKREPQDVLTTIVEKIKVNCEAEGQPDPSITWLRLHSSGQFAMINLLSKLLIIKHQTLGQKEIVSKLKELQFVLDQTTSGAYICRADNGIGEGIEKKIQIQINGEYSVKYG